MDTGEVQYFEYLDELEIQLVTSVKSEPDNLPADITIISSDTQLSDIGRH